MIAPQTCDTRRLKWLLDDQLPDADESVVVEHVAECSTCRTHLEQLAAEPSLWREAARQLRSGEWQSDGTLWLTSRDMERGNEAGADAEGESWITSLDFLEPTDNPAFLGRLGTYDILEVIGSGGFGIVLKGYDRELNRYVAVKLLAPHLAHSAAARKRFAREAQAAAAIVHPHVVPIHAVHASGKLPYLVMPFIPGESLQQRLDRVGPLELKEVLRIGLQTAHGLAAAHAQGLVHRDIKPANILLEHGVDRVMLTDFGLARAMDDASLTRSTVIAGTPQYMSPEQARGDNIDHRADLFSLGSVVYAMCAGHPPFRAESMLGVLRRVSEESPRSIRELNADVPVWLAAILNRLLAKSVANRFQSAAEFADLFERCLAHVQQPTVSPLPEELAPKRPVHFAWRGKPRALAVVATIVVVLACYAAIKLPGLMQPASQDVHRAPEPPPVAASEISHSEISPSEIGPSEASHSEASHSEASTASLPASEQSQSPEFTEHPDSQPALVTLPEVATLPELASSPAATQWWDDAIDWELIEIGAELERLEGWDGGEQPPK